ncbi:hypothetical protein GCM10023168_10630 [Fodinibacter luteus]|uniref:OmpR/PhoB-type domain-containing protein n=1 Tax=Fodinibacter luteus TaxID=552064 RepID=A0ABP8K6K2_9MICO
MRRIFARLYGGVRVEVDGSPVDLGPPRQRALLALLLGRPGRVVDVDHIVVALWGDEPPRTAPHAVQVYVSDLRRVFLETCGRPLVVTRRPGYLLDVGTDEVDAALVEEALEEAARLDAGGDQDAALARIRPVIPLVEGEPLTGVREDGVRAELVPGLTRVRVRVWGLLARCALRAGDLDDAGRAAERVLEADPHDEDAHAVLMEATYLRGRTAEALRRFARVRRLLADELGVDPSPRLVRLHERILLHDPSLAAPLGELSSRNPYKGLRPFTEADAGDFFGRAALAGQVAERLEGGARLLVLVGPSGSGKSSVLAAGIVPLLRRGAVAGLEGCRVVTPPRTMTTEADLRSAVEPPGDDAHPVVLVLDHLEDVLDSGDGEAVLTWLAEEVGGAGPLRVLTALRADRYDRPLGHPAFASLFGDAVVNLVPMTPAELEQAVRAPAARVGRDVEPALLAELIGDTVAQPAVLPLLQFTLTEVFEHSAGATLTLAAYRALGGVRAALARRADELRHEVGADGEGLLAQALLRMTDVDDTGRCHRRVVRVDEVALVAGEEVVVGGVLGRLNDLRLVTYDRDAAGGGTIELSHDALLTEWPWLRELVDRHRTTIRRHRAFVAALDAWEATGRDPAYLLTGPRLAEARSWESSGVLSLTPREGAYLDAGLEVAHLEEQRSRERALREDRLERRSRHRLVLLAAAGVALVASVVAAVAFARAGPTRVALVLNDVDARRDVLVQRGVDDAAGLADLRVVRSRMGEPDDALLGRAAEGSDLVVTSAVAADVPSAARARPGTWFVAVEDTGAGPNVTNLVFADQQSAFLAGAAAALTTRTGHVGFVGGVDVDVLRRFEAGFVAGVAAADPSVRVDVVYGSVAPDFSGFVRPAVIASAAERMLADGADVLYVPAGSAQVGGLQAVARAAAGGREVWAIGADEDMALDEDWQFTERDGTRVLTSTVKRFDVAVRDAVRDFALGRLSAGDRVTDLATGGLSLATTGGHLAPHLSRLAALQGDVVAGRVVVPCVPDGLDGAAAEAAAAGPGCPAP